MATSTATKPRQTRARTPEARAARRVRMLEAAEALFAMEPFADIHMSRVAKKAGLAKGTLYLYFESKESLFLAVVERRLTEWFIAMREALGRHAYIEPSALADVFVRQPVDWASLQESLQSHAAAVLGDGDYAFQIFDRGES